MAIIDIGCCCAYCKTCRAFRDGSCCGCRLGYDNGERDIDRAKCRIKICCMKDKELQTCTDCEEFSSCPILQNWYGKKARKYQRYEQSAEYILEHGYEPFVRIADGWKDALGKLP
jgi:hypothetical protein